MTTGDQSRHFITPETLLRAYAAGVFPMAESQESQDLFWVAPDLRGVIPLDGLNISKSLYRTIKRNRFEVRCSTAFDKTMQGCAESTEDRPDTWINPEIFRLYHQLYLLGCAHSVECWEGDELVGGLYGVALGGAFFGESMFSRRSDASKVALVHLVARLRLSAFKLLDTQFVTDHLSRMGAIEIPRREYHKQLDKALDSQPVFYCDPPESLLSAEISAMFLQSKTQTS